MIRLNRSRLMASPRRPVRMRAAAVVTGLLMLGVSAEAAASVYGGSRLLLPQLTINLLDENDDQINAAGNFSFTLTNTATLNGASSPLVNATCDGTTGSNDCAGSPPRLDAAPANAPGGTVNRTNNSFSFFGPASEQYANSDSVIDNAQLLGDGSSATRQIAEAELQTGSSANANAEIQSTTALNFDFSVLSADGPATLNVNFEADPEMLVEIDQGADFAGGNTQANINMTVGLTRTSGGGGEVSWAPQGTLGDDCSVPTALSDDGVGCSETADNEDLNRTIAVSNNPAQTSHSPGVTASLFGVSILNLPSGDYSLSLNSLTSVSMNQSFESQDVPAPGVLSLLGLGLLGLGVSRRRKRL